MIFSVFLLATIASYVITKPSESAIDIENVLRPEFKILQTFELISHTNTIFNDKKLQGKWSFIFFGFTSCPDVCPITLHTLNSVHNLLNNEAGKMVDDMQVIFISVDPARDSPEKLAKYVNYFNKDFIAATADKEEIDKFIKQFDADYFIEKKISQEKYDVSHTSAIFLVDPRGRLVANFPQPHQAATIASQYKYILSYFSQH